MDEGGSYKHSPSKFHANLTLNKVLRRILTALNRIRPKCQDFVEPSPAVPQSAPGSAMLARQMALCGALASRSVIRPVRLRVSYASKASDNAAEEAAWARTPEAKATMRPPPLRLLDPIEVCALVALASRTCVCAQTLGVSANCASLARACARANPCKRAPLST